MTTQSLYRLTAVTIMTAATLAAVGFPMVQPPPNVTVTANVLMLGFGVLLLAGLPGVYLRQREPAGVLALVGAAVLFVSTVVLMGFNFAGAVIVPVMADGAPGLLQTFPDGPWTRALPVNIAGHIGFAVGWLLLGVATYRARVLPRWAAVAVTAGGVGQVVANAVPRVAGLTIVLVMVMGIFGLGWGLWTVAGQPSTDVSAQRRFADAP